MLITFNSIKVKYHPVSCRKFIQYFKQLFRCIEILLKALHPCFGRYELFNFDMIPVFKVPVIICYRSIYRHFSQPAYERTCARIFFYIEEYFYKTILQYILSFGNVGGISQANTKEKPRIPVIKHLLCLPAVLCASLYYFNVARHTLRTIL